ncbi:MAG: sugar ABC transporter substrate-binding protein [Pseudonocardiales bacterium]|nr:MAG: sugar ABC transporter substrate-binding protein [Pseudonocardiales bacterium]
MIDRPGNEPAHIEASRRQLLKGVGIGGVAAAALAACGGAKKGGNGGHGDFATTPKFKFVIVNHATTNAFFQPTQYGAADACALLGCSYQWTGSETQDVSEMVNAMNSAISSKADGIAIALTDAHGFNTPTQKALAAGIPVVSYNADVDNGRLAYIGQDLYSSGQQVGKKIAELVPSGDVAIFIGTPGALNLQPRIEGAMQAIKASGKPINAKQVKSDVDATRAQAAIDAYYQGNKSIKGLFGVDGTSTQGIAQVMSKYSLHDKGIKGGGYDLLEVTLNKIKSGDLDFTLDQEAYYQGFLPVMYLFMYKLSGGLLNPPETNTGLKFVTKANVDPYLSVKTRFEGSSADQKYVKTS